MAKRTQGLYLFADGYEIWVYGMSAAEKKNLIGIHGQIIRYTATHY